MCLCALPAAVAQATTPAGPAGHPPPLVYILPVDGPIERGLLYVLRRGVAEAGREQADAILLHMHTPGGAVNVTEEIIRLMVDLPPNVRSLTFVDKDALSAGALIALSTGAIYMAPGGRIGASAVVTPFGDLKDGDMKEKVVSSLVALVASAAERQGHDPKIVQAMIRKDAGYTVGGETLCPRGELLTLTDSEAAREVTVDGKTRRILSAGTARNLDDVLDQAGLKGARVVRLTVTWAEQAARWIERLSILFLAAGILGIYVEFKVPGFGLPGMLGIAALAVFFWGHHIAGLAGAGELLVFLLGVVLLGVEIFLIPGFGVAGIAGIALIVAALVMAMLPSAPGNMALPPLAHLLAALTTTSAAFILAFAGAALIGRYLPETGLFGRLVLKASIGHDRGYQASVPSDTLVGVSGVAVTDLRPSGIAMVNGRRIDVVSHEGYVSQGAAIVVAEARGSHIVVKRAAGAV